MDRKAKDMYKGLIVLCFGVLAVLTSCEDSGSLNASENFTSGGLQTIYVDTFSVVTSTVLMDSIPSSFKQTLLVGGYSDPLLGKINSSTNFQISYSSDIEAEVLSEDIKLPIYDSVVLLLPYKNRYYGDTTKAMTLHINEVKGTFTQRSLPEYVPIDKVPVINPTFAIYNTSNISYSSPSILSKSITFFPGRDSLKIRLPDDFGTRLFNVNKSIPDAVMYEYTKSGNFSLITNWFLTDFFKGINLSVDNNTDACIISFGAGTVVRVYYHATSLKDANSGDRVNKRFDFELTNFYNQYNQIDADRSATPLSALSAAKILPSETTGNVSFVQSGIGIYTKVEFPSLKGFLKKSKFVILDAILEVPLAAYTYDGQTPPISQLACYTTDVSNVISGAVFGSGNSALVVPIRYDREYAINTKYLFPLTSFLNTEIKTNAPVITPLALISPNIFSEVNRIVIGNRFHPTNKIKLKIYYTQYGTN
ncbi:MAG: DUF4270 family protein [Cyclobacteriaceae bacterium]|nr:DUF4270 family protein [Cyclobacteriaceae bacterium]